MGHDEALSGPAATRTKRGSGGLRLCLPGGERSRPGILQIRLSVSMRAMRTSHPGTSGMLHLAGGAACPADVMTPPHDTQYQQAERLACPGSKGSAAG